MALAALTLLHLLVLVYWLGGDLGAFYASTILTNSKRPAAARLIAGTMVNNVDMAPRTALILALPTGLSLAAFEGMIRLPGWALGLVWLLTFAWLAVVWSLHRSHRRPSPGLRLFDTVLRFALLGGLVIAASLALAGVWPIPRFLAFKLLLLSGAVGLGLLIRRMLVPFAPAFIGMASEGPTPERDAAIAGALNRARPAVVGIWALILAAAFVGLWKPA